VNHDIFSPSRHPVIAVSLHDSFPMFLYLCAHAFSSLLNKFSALICQVFNCILVDGKTPILGQQTSENVTYFFTHNEQPYVNRRTNYLAPIWDK
jgi:hypothetical protein